MDSFALAYVPAKNKSALDFSVKVNINLWTQCGWEDHDPVLDIGLMISKLSEVERIRLYIPFPIHREELSDLCGCLSKDATLLGAVFNEPYTSADFPAEPKKAKVYVDSSDNPMFILYKLDFSSESDVSFRPYKENRGTFLDFTAKNII